MFLTTHPDGTSLFRRNFCCLNRKPSIVNYLRLQGASGSSQETIADCHVFTSIRVLSHHRLVRTNFHFRYLDWDQPAVCLMCFQPRVWKQSRRRRVGRRRHRRIPATPPTASRKFRTAIRRNVYPLLDKLHLNNLNEISLRIKLFLDGPRSTTCPNFAESSGKRVVFAREIVSYRIHRGAHSQRREWL